jgi:hypothetical protein
MATLLDSYASSNYTASTTAAATESRAQSFTTPADTAYNLASCKFYVYTDTGNVTTRAKLFAHTGTYGTSNGVPTGSALATSDNVVVNEGSSTLITYTFSTPYAMSADTHYCIVLEAEAGESNNFKFGYDGDAPAHSGTYASNASGSWSGSTARDLIFEVYGEVGSTTVEVSNVANVNVAAQVPTISSQVNLQVSNVANIDVAAQVPNVATQVTVNVGNVANVDVAVQVPTVSSQVNLQVSDVANIDVAVQVPTVTSQTKLSVENAANISVEVQTPVITRTTHKVNTYSRQYKQRVGYARSVEVNLAYTDSSLCPQCGSTALTRVLHNTSYNWTCENAHTWLDKGPVNIRIKNIRGV